ncbi:MAG: heme o synthase [Polyangiales bacterium]
MEETLTPTYRLSLADFVSLAKPRITLMVVLTAAGGMFLAPNSLPLSTIIVMLTTTATVVMGANSLNCWLERDTDRLMRRTKTRPLPTGRMNPKVAKAFGLILGAISVPSLTVFVNPLTGALGALALISYVAMYTPMKRRAPSALLIGSVPGALPPLMGWTAATGRLDAPGLALFAILFFWQVPHFIAIATYRKDEYEAAGMKTIVTVRGIESAKLQAFSYAGLLVGSSLLLYAFRVTGMVYLVTASILGLAFVGITASGFFRTDTSKWARQVFAASLVYLTALMAVMMLDAQ